MAENRRFALNHQLDIAQLLSEAQNRWFRPSEVCEILRNYQKFYLTPDPPYKPPGGSLFLFDRKALRYFRKDGHHWRKKKDGKTVREAHEKLKAGSVDVLHCYYAHGEDNENFQRRSYWMLDGQLEHIVLVHYREVKEGNRSAIPSLSTTDAGTQKHTTITQASSAAYSAQVHPPVLEVQASYASSSSTADWNGQAPSENDDVDSEDDFGASSLVEPVSCSRFQIATLHTNDTTIKNTLGCRGIMSFARGSTDAIKLNNGSCNPFYANDEVLPQSVILNKGYQTDYGPSQESDFSELSQKHLGSGFFSGASFNHDASCSTWSEILSSDRHTGSHEHKNSFNQPNGADVIIRKLTESTLDADSAIENGFDGRFRVFHDSHLQMSKGDVQNLVKKWGRADNFKYECCFIWMDASLTELDRYVVQRVDSMMNAGLLDEVCDIYSPNSDYTRGLRQAIGVREFEDFLRCYLPNTETRYTNAEMITSQSSYKVDKILKPYFGEILESAADDEHKILLCQAIDKFKANTRKLVRRQKRRLNRLNTFFGWGMHCLNVTEAFMGNSGDSWQTQVVGPCVNMIRTFLYADANPVTKSETVSAANSRRLTPRDLWTQYVCEACGNRILRGSHEWEQHKQGRGHRKRVLSLQKKSRSSCLENQQQCHKKPQNSCLEDQR